MKQSTLSMVVFALYLTVLSTLLLLYPAAFLLLGFDDVAGPWVRILGYVVGVLAFFYFMAIRGEVSSFYRWTVYARLPLLPFYLALVVLGSAPPVMVLIGLWESGCALWTAAAQRREG